MTELRNNNIKSQDSFSIDSFGRWRTSEPYSIFDSKQLSNNHPSLNWDNAEVAGSGTSTSYASDRASTIISVSNYTEGTRVRQTKRRFNYQPGKSLQILITFVNLQANIGITKRVGYFDDFNGIFLEGKDGDFNIVRRTSVDNPSEVTDFSVSKENWNIDRMNGTGPSKISIDFTKSHIFIVDLEWLGVGRVRCGFVINGIIYYVHQFLSSNSLSSVYMATPNLPIRYEITNEGNGEENSFECICTSVTSEGGFNPNGIFRTNGTKQAKIIAGTSGVFYALLGIRLKESCLHASVILEKIVAIIDSNDAAYWEIRFNPSVANTFNYTDLSNGVVQTAVGTATNTVTGGIVLDCGYISSSGAEANAPIQNELFLGSKIDGTRDTIVLCVTPFEGDSNLNIGGGLVWREIE